MTIARTVFFALTVLAVTGCQLPPSYVEHLNSPQFASSAAAALE